MAWATNLILLTLSISFFLYLGGYPNTFTNFACGLGLSKYSEFFTCPTGEMLGCVDILGFKLCNFYDILYKLTWLMIGSAIALSFIFPNPYSLYAPITLFLLGFFSFPIGIFNEAVGIPTPVIAIITIFWGVSYAFSILAWSRGSGIP